MIECLPPVPSFLNSDIDDNAPCVLSISVATYEGFYPGGKSLYPIKNL